MPEMPEAQNHQVQSATAIGTARAHEKQAVAPAPQTRNRDDDKKPQSLPKPKSERWRDIELKDRLMILSTIGILLIAGFTGWIFVRQANLMQGQLDEMKGGGEQTDKIIDSDKRLAAANERFAKAMEQTVIDSKNALDKTIGENKKSLAANLAQSQKALNATVSQFHLDQRAWVAATDIRGTPQADQPFYVTIIYRNTGKTFAKNLYTVAVGQILGRGEKPNFSLEDKSVTEDSSITVLAPSGEFQNSLHLVKGGPDEKLTQVSMDALKTEAVTLFVFGHATYDDVFGCKHWVRFCDRLDGKTMTWKSCAEHNDADNNQCPSGKR